LASQDWFEKDFYAVLGVKKDVTEAELKKVYRKLARQYHPDSNPGDAKAEARFKEISEAYSVLSDPESRAEYDQIRAMGSGARFTSGGRPGQPGGFEDVFSGFGGGGRTTFTASNFDDLFSMFGGGAGMRFGGPTRGRDLTASTTLEFTTAIKGDTVKLEQQGGRSLTVKIPAGVKDGQKIKLKGKGEPSPDGGEPGDLVLTVTVRKHPVFERDGNNLRVVVPVTFTEAALGATVEVPTLGGNPVKLKIPAGTPSGRILRVKGRGVQTAKSTGDLLAEVQVVVPNRLPDDAREALERFEAAMPKENPREELIAKARAS
jgi:molecular chaperone DnaJ